MLQNKAKFKTRNIPRLRFSEFVVAWEEKRLGELSRIYDGTHQTPEYVKEGIPFYSVEHLTANDFSNTKYIAKEIFEKENKRVRLERNDILMTRIGDIGTARLIDWDVQASYYVSLALIKHSEKINSHFLSQYINSVEFQKELWKRTIHVAFPKKINLGEISECKLLTPSLPEQQKIATFLEAIDDWIGNLRAQKKNLEAYKKGMMQKIFSQEIRFKDDKGKEFPKWENKRIEELCDVIGGGTPDTTKTAFWNGKINWFTPTEIKQKYSTESLRKISELGFKQSSSKLLPIGTLLFTSRATVGDISISKLECTTNQGFQSMVVNKENDNEFLYYWVKHSKKEFLRRANGSTFLEISGKEIRKMKGYFPCFQGQQKISGYLVSLDDLIELKQQQITSAEQWKKGLMQGLFV